MNAAVEVPTRVCGTCRREKPWTPEHFDQNARTGALMRSCRACANRYWRKTTRQPRQRSHGPQKLRTLDAIEFCQLARTHTAPELAVRYRVSRTTIYGWLRLHGVSAKPAPRGIQKGYVYPHNRTTPRRLSWLVQGGLW